MIESKYRFYDYFIPDAFRYDAVQYTQALIWISVVAFNTAFALFGLLYIEFFLPDTVDEISLAIGRSLIIFNIVTYLIARLFYYWLNRLQLAGHIVTFGLFSSILCGILLTGGYMESPLPALLIVPAMLAFVMMGLGPGICWSILTVAMMLAMWMLEKGSYLHPLQLISDAAVAENVLLLVPLTIVAMVAGGMIIYEVITIDLRNALQREKNKYQWDATHDSMTGLPNRTAFNHHLALGMHQAELNHQAMALVYIDLDEFKPVNDRLGHQVGDEVLKIISRRLQNVFRDSDTVARLGGDEFAIILHGVHTGKERIKIILAKILMAISEEIIINGKPMSVGCSIGVAYYTDKRVGIGELCRHADEALYKAKERKNTWFIYDEHLSHKRMHAGGFSEVVNFS